MDERSHRKHCEKRFRPVSYTHLDVYKRQVYGVWAVRSAASMFGHAEAWCKEDGRPLEFESLEAAQAYALSLIHI